mgnify:CR=1 FL=1
MRERKLTIFINNPYKETELSSRLFYHTVENAKMMYPDSDVVAFPKEDYRQKQIWDHIYRRKDKIDIACVVSAGHIFLEPGKTFELVLEQTKGKRWWAIGHMLERVNEGFYLRMFNSCYFVNITEMYDQILEREGGIVPGFRPSIDRTEWQAFERSKENHHDNYTPIWLQHKQGTVTNLKEHGGSLLISTGLKKHIRFESFNQAVRDSKEYPYMEHDSFDDQTWKDLLVYLDTNTIPNTENDENYWWFYRDFEVNH